MFQTFESTADGSLGPQRLAALRERLEALGADGMLVPRADAHQGETVAPRDARLAWLTGFTGSAGVAVVLADRAALFVDGRYTLQAAGQVDPAFEVVPVHETSVEAWLKRHLSAEQRLGFDPWLHGRDEIDRLGRGAADAGASLVSLKANPIDAIWEDQPPPPSGAVRVHPVDLAGETGAAKRARLGAALAAQGCTAAVLSLPDSIAWLLNIRGSDIAHTPVVLCFAILAADGGVRLFLEPDRIDGAVTDHLGEGVGIAPPEALGPALDALSGPVRLDRKSCPLWIAGRLEAAGVAVDWGDDPCIAPKARKSAAELAGIRAAHLRDGVAVTRFLHWCDRQAAAGTPLTEIALVERLEAFRAETGMLEDISFDTICGSGPHGAIVHYRVTRGSDRQIAAGEVVLVDSGGQYRDGTTDITRTICWGHPPAEAVAPFTLVLAGMIDLSRARWPRGMAGRDLDPLARAALWRAGLDYDHGTGHGVGAFLGVHEGPASLSRRGTVALEPGMLLSNEPGCYRPGAWGIRIENLVTVTEAAVPRGGDREMLGFETVTLAPIDRRLIDPGLLSPAQIAWLDAYHARVVRELTPLLPADVAEWLAEACRPLSATA